MATEKEVEARFLEDLRDYFANGAGLAERAFGSAKADDLRLIILMSRITREAVISAMQARSQFQPINVDSSPAAVPFR